MIFSSGNIKCLLIGISNSLCKFRKIESRNAPTHATETYSGIDKINKGRTDADFSSAIFTLIPYAMIGEANIAGISQGEYSSESFDSRGGDRYQFWAARYDS